MDIERLGLLRPKIFAKVFKHAVSGVVTDSSEKYVRGVSTPTEMAHLIARVANGTAVSPASDSAMSDMEMLPRGTGSNSAIHG